MPNMAPLDESLVIDEKIMCNAIDENNRQAHIMSAIGHESGNCHTQKKWVRFLSKVAMKSIFMRPVSIPCAAAVRGLAPAIIAAKVAR